MGIAADLPVILIAEDDISLQEIIENALKEAGFETVVAASAEEAITLFQGNIMSFRALVTDITLVVT